MTDPDRDDAEWLAALRSAVDRERKIEASGSLPSLSAEDRERVTRAAAAALVKSNPPLRRATWLRWGGPVAALAAAACLVVFLRGRAPTQASNDVFVAYETELAGVASARGADALGGGAITVARGFPFSVVLRPLAESDPPVRYAYAFLRGPSGFRDAAALAIDVAPSGAVRVAGRGENVEDAADLVIVLTKRRASPVALRARVAQAVNGSSPHALLADAEEPSAEIFTVTLRHAAPSAD